MCPCVFEPRSVTATVYSDSSIPEYDIVTAYEVDQNGDYISHAVAHHERRKRSMPAGESDSLHLRFQGFGHDFQLDLKTSDFLVAPGFTIQTLGKGKTKSIQTYPAEDFCFYQGVLRLHKNSSVALSTCGGLVSEVCKEHCNLQSRFFLKGKMIVRSHLQQKRRLHTLAKLLCECGQKGISYIMF